MRRVEFEADTIEELVDMARRWVAAYPELASGPASSSIEPAPEQLEDVLARIKSPASLQFLREVAARSLVGDALPIDDSLRQRCGLAPGGSFVGVLGVANRTMRRRAGRQLVTWDPLISGYQMTPQDARKVIDAIGPPDSP